MAAPDSPASTTSYRGRFAPSPTGPLHAGSVLTALASYLDARSRNGMWFVRIEDLDPPRESREALVAILHALETLGLVWDGPLLYQSQRHAAYHEALERLQQKGLLYACQCSRRKAAVHGAYPGYCRELGLSWHPHRARRIRVQDAIIGFTDRLQGRYEQNLEQETGDFVVRRRDGFFAYQLAVVVDDAWQGITDVVRGVDLLDSTPRQIWLQQCLQLATPTYAHVPVIVNAQGQKLGKQQHARPVDLKRPGDVLIHALQRLRQHPDPALQGAAPADILAWATTHWRPRSLHGIRQIPEIAGSSQAAV